MLGFEHLHNHFQCLLYIFRVSPFPAKLSNIDLLWRETPVFMNGHAPYTL